MHQHADIADVVHVLAVDLDVVDALGRRAAGQAGDAFDLVVRGPHTLAGDQPAGLDERLAVDPMLAAN